MHTRILTCLLASCAVASAQITNSSGLVPAEHFKVMVEREGKAASSDFAAACINLARDVQEKKLTVYSVVSTVKTSITNEAGFRIQVVYHSALAENYEHNLGSYQRHYNSCLLNFALAQYAEGRKALGLRLVRKLAEAEPRLSWSSARIEPTSINKILASLEADDGSLTDMMKEAVRDWHQRERDYKP